LVAAVNGGGIYTSSDGGVTWTQSAAPQLAWKSVAISSDGTKIIGASMNGGIYTNSIKTSTVGVTGGISGPQSSFVKLQYAGSGEFIPISSGGNLTIY